MRTERGKAGKFILHPSRPSRVFILSPKWLLRIGGTLLLLFFLTRLNLDPAKIWQDLATANLWLIGAAVMLVFPFIAVKAWRWQLVLSGLGITLGFGAAYRLYAVGLAAGSFTPGQAGDAIKAWYLRERGHNLSTGLISIVLDRLFDLAVLVMLATGGLFFLGADFVGELPVLLFLLVCTLVGLLALSIGSLRNRLITLALQIFWRKKDTEAQAVPVVTNSRANFLWVFGATLAASLLALFRIWLLALALGLNLNPLQVVAVSSLAQVVSLVPVSVGGIGARDVTLVAILAKIGYAREKAVSLSSLILLLNLVNLVVGYTIWALRPSEEKQLSAIKTQISAEKI